MNKLRKMVELLGSKRNLEFQLQEVQSALNPINEKISEINERIPFNSKLHSFLCEKIMETFTEDYLNEVYKYRKLTHPNQFIPTETVYVASKIFDPYYDSWHIYDYEQEGDKIRFKVSCRKNEGSISGLMTFLDTYCTDWIEMSDLDMFNEEI